MLAKAGATQFGCRSAVALLAVLVLLRFLPATAQEASEAQLKAAFIYNFVRFTEWPTDSFPSPDSPLVIGVSDAPAFARTLEESVSGKLVNGRSIRVKQVSSEADLQGRLHILYVGSNSNQRAASILTILAGASVLTVGESEHFARDGGMIRLFVQESHMRFEINTDSIDRAHLKLSARLLALARIIRSTSAGR